MPINLLHIIQLLARKKIKNCIFSLAGADFIFRCKHCNYSWIASWIALLSSHRLVSFRLHLEKNDTAGRIHAWQSTRVTTWTDSQMRSLNRSSAVNAFRLTPAFTFDQDFSMGFKKGEYGRRYKHLYSLLSTSSYTLSGVCIGALSIIDNSPSYCSYPARPSHWIYKRENARSLFQLDHLPPSPLCHLPFSSWILIPLAVSSKIYLITPSFRFLSHQPLCY
jgi:hypothetical protein